MDNEIKGVGNYISYPERGYDPRLGRWLKPDVYAPLLAPYSPYSFALNSPIILVDEDGNWPKPSDFMPDDTPPFLKGLVDGVWEGLTGSAGFVWDYITDKEFKQQTDEFFKTLISDPMGTLQGIVDDYKGMIDRLASGEGTDEDFYNLGNEIGTTSIGVVLGGSTIAAKKIRKLAKPKINKSKLAKEAKKKLDVNWKSKIEGKAQKTGTPGHQFASYRVAIKEAKKPSVKRVTLDLGYNRALKLKPKTITPNRRPDVTSIDENKVVKRIEIQSKTDNVKKLKDRNNQLNKQIENQGYTPAPTEVIKPTTSTGG